MQGWKPAEGMQVLMRDLQIGSEEVENTTCKCGSGCCQKEETK